MCLLLPAAAVVDADVERQEQILSLKRYERRESQLN